MNYIPNKFAPENFLTATGKTLAIGGGTDPAFQWVQYSPFLSLEDFKHVRSTPIIFYQGKGSQLEEQLKKEGYFIIELSDKPKKADSWEPIKTEVKEVPVKKEPEFSGNYEILEPVPGVRQWQHPYLLDYHKGRINMRIPVATKSNETFLEGINKLTRWEILERLELFGHGPLGRMYSTQTIQIMVDNMAASLCETPKEPINTTEK